MFMWGKPDNSMYLRRVLHCNMSQYGCKSELRRRWQKQREWKNTFIPDGGLQYTDEVWSIPHPCVELNATFDEIH